MSRYTPGTRVDRCQVCGGDVELVGHEYVGDCGLMFDGRGECKNCGTKHECEHCVQVDLTDAQKTLLLEFARTQGKKTEPCSSCGAPNAFFDEDPYAAELGGNHTRVWLCTNCRRRNAQEI